MNNNTTAATTKTYTAKIPVWALPALINGKVFDFGTESKAEAFDKWVNAHPGVTIAITDSAETTEQRPEFGPSAVCVTSEVTYKPSAGTAVQTIAKTGKRRTLAKKATPTATQTAPSAAKSTATAAILGLAVIFTPPPAWKLQSKTGVPYWQVEIKDAQGNRYSDVYRCKSQTRADELAHEIAKERKLPIKFNGTANASELDVGDTNDLPEAQGSEEAEMARFEDAQDHSNDPADGEPTPF